MRVAGPDYTDSLKWVSNEYRDLNGSEIDVLDEPPSPLEFSRLVHISRPVIIKGFEFPALTLWKNRYLIQKIGERQISVAVTPTGLADAIARGSDGRLYFVEPCIEKMTMQELFAKLGASDDKSSEVCYLQSQNGNLYSGGSFNCPPDNTDISEFEPLTCDVPKHIPWCSEALGHMPEAVNIWIGDQRSTTSIHCDPYENVYTVVRGKKHFFLLPPTDGWCLKERYYPHARYTRQPLSERLEIIPSSGDIPKVRWSSISNPENLHALPPEILPIRVTLMPGETLYLPVGWWHHVRQSGVTVALNWWYDAELRGMSWIMLNMLRNPVDVLPANDEE